ncbi:MAG: hypothetical protein EOS65_02525 [Mesorhizobium sp.]|uniref:GP88 family protein n=1 Tax=Mesorhizobium sp. TaxID=1871066 RepID=UPI000FE514B7|nr:DUF6551 family protein [Mesorhizobium sp.]RWF44270.1 MAG: hypothetical protein EOS65_02525 [Mesorhizobium sp.]
MALADDHPAMRENRTLFPSTVVTVTADAPDRLLVSGRNNRKIGATVEKGKFKGYGIYCLSLEERATCPADCSMRSACFGNSMHMARRHRIENSDVFFDRLGFEIVELLDHEPEGLSIRLHVLGDFPSVEYVSFWKEVLDENPNVMCWGYTHRAPTNWGGDEIGDAIEAVKDAHPDRFRIRWSSDVAKLDGAIVIDYVPDGPRTANRELVCPAQTDATACCATCGLCWEQPRECIAFVKHGRMSADVEAEAVTQAMRAPAPLQSEEKGAGAALAREDEGAGAAIEPDQRRVQGIKLAGMKPMIVPMDSEPECRMVPPSDLLVEESYQRGLSGKSMRLIRKIISGWDWAKFKPPVVAESDAGLFVIDGQHTAIAAASHPTIRRIPVMVVKRDRIQDRAEAFVSQNTERVVMSPLQIFHAEVIAKNPSTFEMLKAVIRAGCTVPRTLPKKGQEQPGEIVSIHALRHVWASGKPDHFERVLRIAKLSGQTPCNTTLIRGIHQVLKMEADGFPEAVSVLDDNEIAFSVSKIDIERQAAEVAAESECSRYDALASLIQTYVWDMAEEYNAHWLKTREVANAPTALAS